MGNPNPTPVSIGKGNTCFPGPVGIHLALQGYVMSRQDWRTKFSVHAVPSTAESITYLIREPASPSEKSGPWGMITEDDIATDDWVSHQPVAPEHTVLKAESCCWALQQLLDGKTVKYESKPLVLTYEDNQFFLSINGDAKKIWRPSPHDLAEGRFLLVN